MLKVPDGTLRILVQGAQRVQLERFTQESPYLAAEIAELPDTVAESPELTALSQSLARYDTVAVDPRYRALARRREFQATHQLLRQYVLIRTSSAQAGGVSLPPPPTDASSSGQQWAGRQQTRQ